MLKTLHAGLVIVALALALPTANALSAETAAKSAAVQRDDIVRAVLIDLESAIASESVEKAGAQFAEDVIFIDESGEEVRGRKALSERFVQLFKPDGVPTIGIHPQSIAFPADNVALVVGEISRKTAQQHLPVTRFSMVMVKKNAAWQIQEVTETAMKSAQAVSRLQELSWLIGQWSAEKSDGSAKLIVEWAPAKKFITSKYTLNRQGMEPQLDTQVIGWDPQHNSIISWHFDGNGGFGSGTWVKHPTENRWTVNVAGVSADGGNSMASNVFNVKTDEEFVWQSLNRSLDGVAVGDTETITVRRVKP